MTVGYHVIEVPPTRRPLRSNAIFRILTRIPRFLLLALMLSVLLAADVPRLNPAEEAAIGHHFSLTSWEARNLLSKWTHRLGTYLPWRSQPDLGGRALVEEYLRLDSEVRRLRGEIDRAAAIGDAAALANAEGDLVDLEGVRRSLRGAVEEVIESAVSGVLSDLDIGSWGPFDYPPVDIRLDEPPRVLITSPRDRIMRSYEALVSVDITVEEREVVEAALLEDEDLSAMVMNIGGVATYPAIVAGTGNLRSTLQTAAHEWVHHYLVAHLRPLGLRVFTAPEMLVINETLSEMAGREIGDIAFLALGGTIDPPIDLPPRAEADTAPADTGQFDFAKEMRETRFTADELLAQGDVGGAEAYMEARRELFVENGFYIRKLNQAYFAFNGTYAEQPESSSPVGAQMRDIRAASPDVKALIATVSSVSTLAEFEEAHHRAGAASDG